MFSKVLLTFFCLFLGLAFGTEVIVKATANQHNVTYGEHLTEVKIQNVAYGNHFVVDIYNTPMSAIEDGDEFVRTINEIVSFNNGTCVNSKIHMFGNEKLNPYTALFLLAESHISFHTWNEHNYVAFDLYTCGNNINTYNVLGMILHYFKSDNYRVKHVVRSTLENVDTSKYPHYKKGDLMIKDASLPAIIHDSKVISWKKTKLQNALFFESKTLGKGLLVNSNLQYLEKLNEKNIYVVDKVKEFGAKKILIIGENDMSVLKSVIQSKHEYESLDFVYNDEELITETKKSIHHDFDAWMDTKKSRIIIQDTFKFLMELSTDSKYDLILIDGIEINNSLLKLFKIIKDNHLTSNGKILLKSMEETLEQSPLKDIFTITYKWIDAPKTHNFYTLE
eukprot:gene6870-11032_t